MMIFAPIPKEVPLHACETVSGRYVDVVNPNPADIDLHDIAWSISRQARYAGHTLGEPYMVAQHAVFVEFLLGYVLSEDSNGDRIKASLTEWMMDHGHGARCQVEPHREPIVLQHALCHDNTEAYLVDLPSPVKRHPALRAPYKELESNLKKVIDEALEIPACTPEEEDMVVWADLMALQIEAANLMPSRGRGWAGKLPYFELRFMEFMPKIEPWRKAYDSFIERFSQLRSERARFERWRENTGIS